MNKRIKELADEAEDYADGIVDQGGEFHEAYTKKFAELIVRECIGFCDDAKTAYTKLRKTELDFNEKNIWAEGEIASNTIKHKIKKHFGIEK